MLTAYLFWGEIVSGKINFNTFYLKQIYRLASIVITVITVVSLIDFIISPDKTININRIKNFIINYSFGFSGVNDVFLQICI